MNSSSQALSHARRVPLEYALPFYIPWGLFGVFYGGQSVLGLYVADPELARRFVAILVVAAGSFYGCYRLSARLPFPAPSPGLTEGMRGALTAAAVLYALILLYAVVTAEAVPLFASLAGADRNSLAILRETFLRTREGGEQAVHYAYVISNNAVMPVVTTCAFYYRQPWRYALLALFLLGLGLTLQKGAAASAMLPLMALWILQARYGKAVLAGLCLVALVVLTYVLASGRVEQVVRASDHRPISAPTVLNRDLPVRSKSLNVSAVPAQYNITGRSDQLSLAFNRIMWIPYITGIDWLRYQRDNLGGKLLLGRSIRPLSVLLGVEHLPLEREVSRIQWGQNETGTASSNAAYFADAYVNFGMLGVVLYSCVLAAAIRLLVASRSLPLIAAAFVPIYTSFFVGLPPVLFSGGLAFLLLLAALTLIPGARRADALPQQGSGT